MKSYFKTKPSQEDIDFFGYEHDEKGYYVEIHEQTQEELRASWSEYWSQFSQEEITSLTF